MHDTSRLAWGLLLALASASCSGSGLTAELGFVDAGGDSDATLGDADAAPDTADTAGAADGLMDASPSDAPSEVAPDGDVTADPDGDAGAEVEVGPPPMWQGERLGDPGELDAVHLVTPQEAYAVGGRRVLRFGGGTWATYGEPSEQALHDVWAGDGAVVVVGDGGTIARRGADDLGWTVDDTPTSQDLYGLFARGLDDLWAVGDAGTILHDDGTGWAVAHDGGTRDLKAVWGTPLGQGADGIYVVGAGGRLLQADADLWTSKQIASPDATLYDVWGAGDSMVAVGSLATIAYKASGSLAWKGQITNDPKERDLDAILGFGEDDVLVFGRGGAVIRFDGGKWNVQNVKGPYKTFSDLVGAGRASQGDESLALAVAADGGGLVLDGKDWVDLSTLPDGGLRAIGGPDAEHLWAVGPKGLMMARTSLGWTSVPSGTVEDLSDLAVAEDGTVWVVGAHGTLFERGPDGARVDHSGATAADLFGVATRDGEVVACGFKGTFLRRVDPGGDFVPAYPGTSLSLFAATWGGAGDGALWLAGESGQLLRAQGHTVPKAVATGTAGALRDVVATGGGVLAVGDGGVIVEASAGGATLLHEQPGLYLHGASVAGASTFVVGWKGTVLRRTPDGFVPERSGTKAVLEAVWHDGSRALVGGRLGEILTRLEAPR